MLSSFATKHSERSELMLSGIYVARANSLGYATMSIVYLRLVTDKQCLRAGLVRSAFLNKKEKK